MRRDPLTPFEREMLMIESVGLLIAGGGLGLLIHWFLILDMNMDPRIHFPLLIPGILITANIIHTRIKRPNR